jgi:hypothetical protein
MSQQTNQLQQCQAQSSTMSSKTSLKLLLAILDPITIDEVLALAHALHKADALVVESKTKHEMMEANCFIAKVT